MKSEGGVVYIREKRRLRVQRWTMGNYIQLGNFLHSKKGEGYLNFALPSPKKGHEKKQCFKEKMGF